MTKGQERAVDHTRVKRSLSVVALLLATLLVPAAAAQADSTVRIIVKRDPGLSGAERAAIRADAGVQHVESVPLADTEVVSAPKADAAAALKRLNANPDVRYAEPVVTYHAVDAPGNDTYFNELWALDNTGQTIGPQAGVPDADIDAIEAWSLSRGAGQVVGVVDTGTYLSQPDLAGRIAAGGQSFVAGVTSPDDDSTSGHGTHVSGIIAADEDNSIGTAGVAPSAQVLPLKALNASGSGSSAQVAAAFAYAGDHGLRVVNASLGGGGYSQLVRDAIASHPNTLYVVAAGNDGTNNDDPTTPQYPCDFPELNIICVGASDNQDGPAFFSNFGTTNVDVFAPGLNILSTLNSSSTPYGYLSGTSMASPMVAGEAALILARYPALSAAQVRQSILGTVDHPAALAGLSLTGGRANAAAALVDTDRDGIPDPADNCRAVPNANQADADRDGVGDLCDSTPRGPDVDGDGKAALDDRCPTQPAATPDGCPAPVTRPSDIDGDGRPDASDACPTVPALTPDRPARVTMKVERRVCARGRCRWSRVVQRSFSAGTGGATQYVRRLRRGRYRVTVTLTATAGTSAPVRRSFTVR